MINLEMVLKLQLTNMHKELFGRGPGTIYVKIAHNTVVIRQQDCLTTMEKNLCHPGVCQGLQSVEEVRNGFLKDWIRSGQAEEVLGAKVLDSFVKVYPSQDIVYCYIITITKIPAVEEALPMIAASNS